MRHGGAGCSGKGTSRRGRLRGRVGVKEGPAAVAIGHRGGADVPDLVGRQASPRGQRSSGRRLPKGGGFRRRQEAGSFQRASRRGWRLPVASDDSRRSAASSGFRWRQARRSEGMGQIVGACKDKNDFSKKKTRMTSTFGCISFCFWRSNW
jgi:hypothetical protein